MPNFKKGQQVICTNASFLYTKYGEKLPVLNGVYTVRNFVSYDGVHVCLRLKEIVNKINRYASPAGLVECSFLSTRFAAVGNKPH